MTEIQRNMTLVIGRITFPIRSDTDVEATRICIPHLGANKGRQAVEPTLVPDVGFIERDVYPTLDNVQMLLGQLKYLHLGS